MPKIWKGKDKFFTLMLVPHNERKVYSVRISTYLLIFLSIVWAASVGLSSFIITRHVNYELTNRANVRLAEKNAYCIQELSKAHDEFQRVAKIEEDFRALLKMKSEKTLFKYTGEGGPTLADQEHLMQTLSGRPALTQKEFSATLQVLHKNARTRLESYDELKRYIAKQRSLLAARPTAWPVRGWVTSRFGMRQSPYFEEATFHQGIDIANEEGTSVKAGADGLVTYADWEGSYGQLVVLDHGYGFSTRFGHLQRSLVSAGQRVKRGQVIGFMGNTGRSTAPHLHYEIRVNGVPVDPFKYLQE